MTEPLLILAVLALGFFAGLLFPDLWKDRLGWEVQRRTPRRCAECGAWCWTSGMESARHKLAGWVRVCPRCYAEHYKPFSKG